MGVLQHRAPESTSWLACACALHSICWGDLLQGMRAVGPHVAPQLCEIVKLRNKLARSLGYEDFYDYKASPRPQLGYAYAVFKRTPGRSVQLFKK